MAKAHAPSKAQQQERAGKRALPREQAVALLTKRSSNTDADEVAMAERLVTILEYRKMGATLQQIATKFELTPGRVSQLISDAIARLPKQAAEDVKTLELERCDAMQFALWPAALKGDIGAITTILAIMNRRARYLGLDEAEALDVGLAMKAGHDDARNALLGRLLTMQERMAAAPSPALPKPET